LDELTNIITKKEKTASGVLAFSRQFNPGQLLTPFSDVKKTGKNVVVGISNDDFKSFGWHERLRHAANKPVGDG
jgi:hypothetical protein